MILCFVILCHVIVGIHLQKVSPANEHQLTRTKRTSSDYDYIEESQMELNKHDLKLISVRNERDASENETSVSIPPLRTQRNKTAHTKKVGNINKTSIALKKQTIRKVHVSNNVTNRISVPLKKLNKTHISNNISHSSISNLLTGFHSNHTVKPEQHQNASKINSNLFHNTSFKKINHATLNAPNLTLNPAFLNKSLKVLHKNDPKVINGRDVNSSTVQKYGLQLHDSKSINTPKVLSNGSQIHVDKNITSSKVKQNGSQFDIHKSINSPKVQSNNSQVQDDSYIADNKTQPKRDDPLAAMYNELKERSKDQRVEKRTVDNSRLDPFEKLKEFFDELNKRSAEDDREFGPMVKEKRSKLEDSGRIEKMKVESESGSGSGGTETSGMEDEISGDTTSGNDQNITTLRSNNETIKVKRIYPVNQRHLSKEYNHQNSTSKHSNHQGLFKTKRYIDDDFEELLEVDKRSYNEENGNPDFEGIPEKLATDEMVARENPRAKILRKEAKNKHIPDIPLPFNEFRIDTKPTSLSSSTSPSLYKTSASKNKTEKNKEETKQNMEEATESVEKQKKHANDFVPTSKYKKSSGKSLKVEKEIAKKYAYNIHNTNDQALTKPFRNLSNLAKEATKNKTYKLSTVYHNNSIANTVVNKKQNKQNTQKSKIPIIKSNTHHNKLKREISTPTEFISVSTKLFNRISKRNIIPDSNPDVDQIMGSNGDILEEDSEALDQRPYHIPMISMVSANKDSIKVPIKQKRHFNLENSGHFTGIWSGLGTSPEFVHGLIKRDEAELKINKTEAKSKKQKKQNKQKNKKIRQNKKEHKSNFAKELKIRKRSDIWNSENDKSNQHYNKRNIQPYPDIDTDTDESHDPIESEESLPLLSRRNKIFYDNDITENNKSHEEEEQYEDEDGIEMAGNKSKRDVILHEDDDEEKSTNKPSEPENSKFEQSESKRMELGSLGSFNMRPRPTDIKNSAKTKRSSSELESDLMNQTSASSPQNGKVVLAFDEVKEILPSERINSKDELKYVETPAMGYEFKTVELPTTTNVAFAEVHSAIPAPKSRFDIDKDLADSMILSGAKKSQTSSLKATKIEYEKNDDYDDNLEKIKLRIMPPSSRSALSKPPYLLSENKKISKPQYAHLYSDEKNQKFNEMKNYFDSKAKPLELSDQASDEELQRVSDQLAESDTELANLNAKPYTTGAESAYLAKKLEEKNDPFAISSVDRHKNFQQLQKDILKEQENYKHVLNQQHRQYQEQQKLKQEEEERIKAEELKEDRLLIAPTKSSYTKTLVMPNRQQTLSRMGSNENMLPESSMKQNQETVIKNKENNQFDDLHKPITFLPQSNDHFDRLPGHNGDQKAQSNDHFDRLSEHNGDQKAQSNDHFDRLGEQNGDQKAQSNDHFNRLGEHNGDQKAQSNDHFDRLSEHNGDQTKQIEPSLQDKPKEPERMVNINPTPVSTISIDTPLPSLPIIRIGSTAPIMIRPVNTKPLAETEITSPTKQPVTTPAYHLTTASSPDKLINSSNSMASQPFDPNASYLSTIKPLVVTTPFIIGAKPKETSQPLPLSNMTFIGQILNNTIQLLTQAIGGNHTAQEPSQNTNVPIIKLDTNDLKPSISPKVDVSPSMNGSPSITPYLSFQNTTKVYTENAFITSTTSQPTVKETTKSYQKQKISTNETTVDHIISSNVPSDHGPTLLNHVPTTNDVINTTLNSNDEYFLNDTLKKKLPFPVDIAYQPRIVKVNNNTKEIEPRADGYVGCYIDYLEHGRDLPVRAGIPFVTPNNCMSACKRTGYRYAGLQYGYLCFCGNNYGQYDIVPDSECDTICSGDRTHTCGGLWRNEIYSTEQASLESNEGPVAVYLPPKDLARKHSFHDGSAIVSKSFIPVNPASQDDKYLERIHDGEETLQAVQTSAGDDLHSLEEETKAAMSRNKFGVMRDVQNLTDDDIIRVATLQQKMDEAAQIDVDTSGKKISHTNATSIIPTATPTNESIEQKDKNLLEAFVYLHPQNGAAQEALMQSPILPLKIEPGTHLFRGEITLQQSWYDDLSKPSSTKYKILTGNIEQALKNIFVNETAFLKSEIMSLREAGNRVPHKTIADFTLTFTQTESTFAVTHKLFDAVLTNSKLDEMPVFPHTLRVREYLLDQNAQAFIPKLVDGELQVDTSAPVNIQYNTENKPVLSPEQINTLNPLLPNNINILSTTVLTPSTTVTPPAPVLSILNNNNNNYQRPDKNSFHPTARPYELSPALQTYIKPISENRMLELKQYMNAQNKNPYLTQHDSFIKDALTPSQNQQQLPQQLLENYAGQQQRPQQQQQQQQHVLANFPGQQQVPENYQNNKFNNFPPQLAEFQQKQKQIQAAQAKMLPNAQQQPPKKKVPYVLRMFFWKDMLARKKREDIDVKSKQVQRKNKIIQFNDIVSPNSSLNNSTTLQMHKNISLAENNTIVSRVREKRHQADNWPTMFKKDNEKVSYKMRRPTTLLDRKKRIISENEIEENRLLSINKIDKDFENIISSSPTIKKKRKIRSNDKRQTVKKELVSDIMFESFIYGKRKIIPEKELSRNKRDDGDD